MHQSPATGRAGTDGTGIPEFPAGYGIPESIDSGTGTGRDEILLFIPGPGRDGMGFPSQCRALVRGYTSTSQGEANRSLPVTIPVVIEE